MSNIPIKCFCLNENHMISMPACRFVYIWNYLTNLVNRTATWKETEVSQPVLTLLDSTKSEQTKKKKATNKWKISVLFQCWLLFNSSLKLLLYQVETKCEASINEKECRPDGNLDHTTLDQSLSDRIICGS